MLMIVASGRKATKAEMLRNVARFTLKSVQHVAYLRPCRRKKKNDYASNIWLVPADGGREPVRFTTGDKRDMTPRWSPKGDELAFISTRSGKPQLWIIPLAGGEARRLTRAKRGVGDLAWS